MDLQQQQEFERLLMIEHTRKLCEATYTKKPLDADNLTRWAEALLELSPFQNVQDSKRTIQDAMSKLDEALLINPHKHEALWTLGNAHTTTAFITLDPDEAKESFDKASQYFLLALTENPGNDLYQKSLEIAAKGPLLRMELQRQSFGQQEMQGAAAGPSTSFGAKPTKKNKSSDLKYDICGWIILCVGIHVWLKHARSLPPPPLPPM